MSFQGDTKLFKVCNVLYVQPEPVELSKASLNYAGSCKQT